MGSGSAGLIWYFACTFFVAFVTIVACGLVLYGRRKEKHARNARQLATRQASLDTHSEDGPAQ